jgi:colanic acid biosynthesis glycosyl transferase WcaI
MTSDPPTTRPGTRTGPCHLLIITPYFWPVPSASTHLMKTLAEGLAEEGLQVTILTNGPGPASRAVADHPLLQGRIHRARNPFLRRLGILPKFGEYLWFMAFFLLRGLAVRKVDLIFVASTPPLAGLPAAMLARLKGASMVYNLQDIFPDSAVVAGILPAGGRIYRWLRKAEEATYRVSDMVASISPSFSDYVQRLVPGAPVATIPNWVDTEAVRPRERAEDPGIAEFRKDGDFVVQYAGNIGFMQNLESVLLAAECLSGVPDIRFVFIGDGNAKRALEDLARQRGLKNCDFLPLQPLERVPTVYNACNLGVIPLKPGAAQIAVPSKTWNYLAAGRPVVGCVEEDSPLADAIRESRSGAVVPPCDPQRLAQVILEYRNAPERVQQEGRQGRSYVEAHLSGRAAVQRYIQMFDHMLGRPARGS